MYIVIYTLYDIYKYVFICLYPLFYCKITEKKYLSFIALPQSAK